LAPAAHELSAEIASLIAKCCTAELKQAARRQKKRNQHELATKHGSNSQAIPESHRRPKQWARRSQSQRFKLSKAVVSSTQKRNQ
jgi:hypothetical protein